MFLFVLFDRGWRGELIFSDFLNTMVQERICPENNKLPISDADQISEQFVSSP